LLLDHEKPKFGKEKVKKWEGFPDPEPAAPTGLRSNITRGMQDGGTAKSLIVNLPTGNRFYRLGSP